MLKKVSFRYYFSLQFRMLNRQLAEFGLHPVIGYLLSVITFTGLSVYLFLKTELAVYIYILLGIGLVYTLSETGRNGFLKNCFNPNEYYTIRLIENILLVMPFVVFFLCTSEFLPATLLIVISGFMVIFNFSNNINLTIPTPFYKNPFEFIVGFRNSFYAFIFAYFLVFMAVSVGNFNLGIFALLLTLLICLTFYTKPENEFYVWIFSLSPSGFLWNKIKTALIYSTLLCLPIIVTLCIFFPANIIAVLGFQCLGSVYLVTVILAKYSTFPDKLSLPQALVIAFSISFPPILIGIIPYFYLQSVKRVREILE